MRGISEEELRDLHDIAVRCKDLMRAQLLTDVIHECQELQEPWMTLEEFLKSGYTGWCWIVEITREPATLSYFDSDGVFSGTSGLIVFNEEFITHVMPIHKPEPPR